MASKEYVINDHISITVYKRKANRSLRISISASGKIKVTIPSWTPFSAGLAFAQSRMNWIQEQLVQPTLLEDGHPIGKAHHVLFQPDSVIRRPIGRIKGSQIVVTYPAVLSASDPSVQRAAQSAAVRALRNQSEALLPQRLRQLAEAHQFDYASVSVKQLSSRWGSCDAHKNIVLNLYLMQLPWHCIDYVLLHELTHTKVLQHGSPFWQAMKEVLPNVTALRKEMKGYQPVI
jgi:predicted metal-dependent hydrolase